MSTKSTKNKTGDFLGQKFIITREFAAPRELVFHAWTDPKQLARWWGPRGFTNPVCEWDARPGAKIHVVMRAPNGVDYPMGGEILEVLPPRKLVFSTGALDDKGKMIFEFSHIATFAEKNGKTKFTLHSKVIKTTPGAGKYIGGFEAGMSQSLERLAELVTQPVGALVIERTLSAPIARVWSALTNVEEMRRWYFDLKEFKPTPGFEFQFTVEHKGNVFTHLCKVTKVVPQKTIAYTWRYKGQKGDSLVTIELAADGDKTKVKLTHEGLDTFPNRPEYARQNFEKGWTFIIGAGLKDFVENADREIFVSRDFNAPRELVWEAWTNPDHVANWWGPRGFSTTIEKMDFRVGGVWKHTMRGPDGARYPNEQTFKEIVKHERIVCSHGGKREGGPSVSFEATWTFEELAPGKTRLSMRGLFPSAAERDFVVKEFGAIEGGRQTLEKLGKYLVKMKKSKSGKRRK